jgi:hypothetical protein
MTRNYPNRMSLWHCPEPVAVLRSVRVQFLTSSSEPVVPSGQAPLAHCMPEGACWLPYVPKAAHP